MRDENSKKSKLSWSKSLVKKWFNIKNKAEDFHSDEVLSQGVDEECSSNYSEREACTIRKSKSERSSRWYSDRMRRGRGKNDLDEAQVTDVYNYRIFAATWNVAGKSPPCYLSLEDWLHTSPPADIYVLGFQEIVPLNAGNVLGTEDNGPARKWLALIRRTLNSLPGTNGGCHTPSPLPNPIVELDADFEGSMRQKATSFFQRRSFQSLSRSMRIDNDMLMPQACLDRRLSVCDRVMFGHRTSDYDPNYRWGSSDEENGTGDSPITAQYSPMSYGGCFSTEDSDRHTGHSRYCLVASKQMVGVFLTVWVKSDIRDDVHNMKVSCVGRGLMGYLGNKGSISISMSLHQTSFCFICSHLTSGQKDGDELRRNSDVMEILRKTRFPPVLDIGGEYSPQTILEHDRIIWLGDLNYRIAISYRAAKALVEMHDWKTLLENDQLCIEQRQGRVFEGWNEGKIYFPPTYKYSNNSDRYAGDDRHSKQKRRTPAWCDRILWYGRGLHQLSYVRGESRFSDHRPVYSMFLAEVESVSCNQIKKSSSSRIEGPGHVLVPDSVVEGSNIDIEGPKCPVLVFVNSRSGGQLGGELLKTYRALLNENQVFDLGEEAPDKVLSRIYANLENLRLQGDHIAIQIMEKLRLIVAGGDGTAGWLLGVVCDLKLSHPPPIATVPLGTGNNLPFAFGWGKKNPGTDEQAVKSFLDQVMKAKEMKIDNWHILMRMRAPKQGPCDPIPPLELPHSLHAFHRVSEADELNKEGFHTFRGGFWNYFSMGMDAQVSYAFHSERKLHPEKFKNQLVNQSTYAKLGCTQGWFFAPLFHPPSSNIAHLAKVKVMKTHGGWEDLQIPSSIRSIVCLNLPSFSGGLNPWGTPNKMKRRDRDLTPPYVDDGLIEVVGFRDAWHGLVLLAPNGHGTRLAQAHRIRFEFHKGAAEYTFMRIDGEPWKQPLPVDDDTVLVEISHHGQVNMLATHDSKSKSENDPSSPHHNDVEEDDSDDEEAKADEYRKFGAADTFKIPDEVDLAHLS